MKEDDFKFPKGKTIMDAVGIIYTPVETQSLAAIAAEGLKSKLFRMGGEKLLDGFLFGRDLNAIRVSDLVNAEDALLTIIGFRRFAMPDSTTKRTRFSSLRSQSRS